MNKLYKQIVVMRRGFLTTPGFKEFAEIMEIILRVVFHADTGDVSVLNSEFMINAIGIMNYGVTNFGLNQFLLIRDVKMIK